MSDASINDISEADWERTPASVKRLVLKLLERVEQLEQQYKELHEDYEKLKEQVNRNSGNSSQPPSADGPEAKPVKRKGGSGKKRGGQAGHRGHHRQLFAVEECSEVIDCYPNQCQCCGGELGGSDDHPQRHQVLEIPPIKPAIVEYRLHCLRCAECGEATRGSLPAGVSAKGYGPRVVSVVGMLSGYHRQSQRLVQQAMSDLFGVELSLGSVNQLRQEASEAVAEAVKEAQVYARQQPVVGADETSFPQGNADGKNPGETKGWLWVLVTPLVCVFQVFLSRSQQAAKTLLGEEFSGILNSDRYSSYTWVEVSHRQICWAHLKRDFTKIAQRSGKSQQLGRALLHQHKKLFKLWARVRDGTLEWERFVALVSPIRAKVKQLLEEGAAYPIAEKETLLAKTVRTCRKLLKIEPALWLFISVEGVEPTNNAAERAIRPAVIWRRISFGSQSEAGSTFVARMLTVVTTLKAQNRNVLEFMTRACQAAREGKPTPSLLPQKADLQDELLAAA